MKKSTLVVLIGGFIVLTAFLGPLSQEKMYMKQKNFNSAEEVIKELDNKPLVVRVNNRYAFKESDDFKECLSVRKRITDSGANFSKVDIKEVVDLDEKTESDFLNYYEGLRKKYTKKLPISIEKAVRLKVDTYSISSYYDDNYLKQDDDVKEKFMDLILVDEGEGFVIDYLETFDSGNIPDYSKLHGDRYMSEGYRKQYAEDQINLPENQSSVNEEVENNA